MSPCEFFIVENHGNHIHSSVMGGYNFSLLHRPPTLDTYQIMVVEQCWSQKNRGQPLIVWRMCATIIYTPFTGTEIVGWKLRVIIRLSHLILVSKFACERYTTLFVTWIHECSRELLKNTYLFFLVEQKKILAEH